MTSTKLKNSFNLPCQVKEYWEIHQPSDLSAALRARRRSQLHLPLVPLGEASNVILPPEWECCCLRMAMCGIEITQLQPDSAKLRIAGGENWHSLVNYCLEHGLYGLENLALIPGSVGAAPIQNIGAYGVELKDVLVAVEAVELETGKPYLLARDECGLAYRHSKFKQEWRDKFIITHIQLQLGSSEDSVVRYESLQAELTERGCENPRPEDVFAAVVALRQSRLPDPRLTGNVGSFFHNPVVGAAQHRALKQQQPQLQSWPVGKEYFRLAAASLIEALGFRGYAKAKVAMSEQHALCMINLGAATWQQVLDLATEIQQQVYAKFKVELNVEPRVFYPAET